DEVGQLLILEHAVIKIGCLFDRLFAGMCEADSASALAAKGVEQCEIIASRDADYASNLVPPILLWEKPGEEWTRGTVVERIRLQWQGHRQTNGIGPAQPAGIICEGKAACGLVEPTDPLAKQPDIEPTISHRSP